MKIYSLACNCGCKDPLTVNVGKGKEAIVIFASKELAQIEAADVVMTDGKHPLVKEYEILEV